MTTSKHINKICIAALAVTLLLLAAIVYLWASGHISTNDKIGYEDRIFDTSYVHTVDIVMDDWDTFITNCESEEYSSATIVIDGEKFSNVGLRAKGNTSLSSVSSMGSQRYSFKLEFDQYMEGRSYHGLDKLCLNNLIQDNTMMKDYLAYRMMDEFGVDSPLCSYVYITVNGEDWGLYLAVESIEDSFLQRNYGSESGELYKPDSLSFGGGRGNGQDFNFDDLDLDELSTDSSSDTSSGEFDFSSFGTGQGGGFNFNSFGTGQGGGFDFSDIDTSNFDPNNIEGSFDLGSISNSFGGMGSDDVKLKYIDDDPDSYSNIFDNAKTDISKADKNRLISSLKNLTEYTDLENTVDVDEVIRYFVVHNFVCNGDSYTGTMIHNYYLYEEDGQLSMIPWDYNLAYGTFMGGAATSTVNTSIDDPLSSGDSDDRPMLGWIFSSEEYTNLYHELFAEFIDEYFSTGKLAQMIDETADMLRPYVEKDPTKFCTSEEFEAGVIALSQFVELRAEAVSNQLAGDFSTVYADDVNLSDMGTMNNEGGFGGGSFDGNPGNKPSSGDDSDNVPSFGGDSGNVPSFGGDSGNVPSFGGDSGNVPSFGGDSDNVPSFGGFGGAPGNMPSFDGDMSSFGGGTPSFNGAAGNVSLSLNSILLLIVSLIVLGAGIIIAAKVKHH